TQKYPVIQAKIHANRKKRKHTIKKRKEVKAPNSITTGMEKNQSNLAPEKLELVEISDDEEYWNFETQEERGKRKEVKAPNSITTGMEQNQSNLAPEKLELVEISDDEEYWNFETQEERGRSKSYLPKTSSFFPCLKED
ncbi:unnamed protein product, partial [Meganyctiphanes norvegica]